MSISIPAKPLGEALLQLGEQTSLQIFFSPDVAAGLSAAPLSGKLEPEQALRQLLEGTGIDYVREGNNVTLSRPGEVALTLSAVRVADTALGATTEGTGSYTTGSSDTATRLPLSIRETPQSVSVMTRQRLDDQGLTQLIDVAQQVPGMHVNQTGSPGGDSSAIYSRGFVVENYQVDGMRRLSSYNSVVQSNDLVVFDRAEIVRGAVGLMNGTGTPAATINLIRKRPSDEARVSIKTQVGSWDYYRMEFDAGAPLNDSGSIRGRLVSAYQENDSYVDRLSERKKILYGVLDFDISDNTRGFIGMDIQEHGVQGQMRTGFRPFFTDGTRANWSRSDSSGASWAYSDRK
ncbi:MAG: TonB-dependent receptor plug domain-containing protein, partial [Bacteroidales bacterium]|nr:TonB-dependent receptor plug domain-containing protein [Bacteroidales bacterium]